MDTLVVNRNNVDLTFNPDEVKRGKAKGNKVMNPDISEKNLLDVVIPWAGLKEITQIIKGALRQRAMGWSGEAEEEATKDGVIDMAKYNDVFSVLARDYSARGESIPMLKDQIEELLANFITAATTEEKMAIAEEIKEIQITIQSKKRTKDDETVVK